MIKNILQLLKEFEAYGVSEEIDIAKGKYKIPREFGEVLQSIRRQKTYKK